MLTGYVLCLLPTLSFSLDFSDDQHIVLDGSGKHPLPEFSKHSRFTPRVYHARDKREIMHTRKHKERLDHLTEISVAITLEGKEHTLDLTLNRDLMPKKHFVRHQKGGIPVTYRPSPEELELCQYRGNLRGVPDSWAAISTCKGLRGAVFDGRNIHYIDTSDDSKEDWGTHYIYNHEHHTSNLTCGYQGFEDVVHDHSAEHHHIRSPRLKRSSELIRGPYNANRQSRYVELVLVIDNQIYKSMESDMDAVHLRCKDIANIINALYTPLDIFIALVGVVVWTEADEISLSSKGDNTLTNFLHYRRERLVKDLPNDNAQLLTKIQFEGGVVGKALKGPICTFEFSGGVSMDHSKLVGLVATTVAHEMGHNFGMEHDSQDCKCPDDRCIMAPSSSSTSPTHWSSCSLEYLALAFDHGMDYCLRNKPERLFDSPVCGNGFVEVGEQCDCGLKDRCNNPCCNASTCMLYSNASCATGECCDLSTCHPKVPGTLCRTADHECDLPEYCTGESEYCPSDVFKMDGETCDKGKAFCYQGSCRTHTDQCKLLWGPSGKSSDSQCYKMNTKGSRHGNCGYNRLNQSYIKCFDENIYCGMLHCVHMNERLEFGMESVAILSHSFINSGGSIIPCRTAIVDLGLNEVDPGLSPDGSKCADGKMCVGQRCLPVASLIKSTACQNNCNNNGVCNSLGHCHCNSGFAPPSCRDPGTGGSMDSGPASHPNARREVITAFYIVFLGIVPSVALVSLFIYYIKRNPVFVKKPRAIIHEKRPVPLSIGGRGHGPGGGGVSGPITVDNSSTSLLSKQEGSTTLNGELVGQFKGFSITPIAKNGGPVLLPARPAPKQPSPIVHTTTPMRPAPMVPPQNRPIISSPVLDNTTSCTVKELIGSSVPIRPAPSPPQQVYQVPKPSTQIPEAQTPQAQNHSLEVPLHPLPDPPRNYSTLNRIASFMKGKPEKKDLPKKKIDREVLRNLEISNPILQKDIEIPLATLPAGDKNVVMRAQSMRENKVSGRRAGIPSFGSMREAKRPSSISVTVRPTGPPPRPPSGPPQPDNTYDDCLNLLTENSAPLANIDEESPGSLKENIYAVIDENPDPSKNNAGRVSPEYKVPRPVDVCLIPAGSSESMGLLGEIVSEIEARNNDSIYSASTLKRKKESPQSDYSTCPESSDSQTYVNTSWKDNYSDPSSKSTLSSNSSNSGYLSPINNVIAEKQISETPSLTVPEKEAPYKPYSSSFQRSSGPILAAAYNKSPSPKLKDNKPFTKIKPPLSLNSNFQKTKLLDKLETKPSDNIPMLSSTKPDLVSSCNEVDVKSPDVLGKQIKLKPISNRQLSIKPLAKNNSFKPEMKTNKAEIKTLADKASAAQRASNVAALQQRFENSRSNQTIGVKQNSIDTKPISVKR